MRSARATRRLGVGLRRLQQYSGCIHGTLHCRTVLASGRAWIHDPLASNEKSPRSRDRCRMFTSSRSWIEPRRYETKRSRARSARRTPRRPHLRPIASSPRGSEYSVLVLDPWLDRERRSRTRAKSPGRVEGFEGRSVRLHEFMSFSYNAVSLVAMIVAERRRLGNHRNHYHRVP